MTTDYHYREIPYNSVQHVDDTMNLSKAGRLGLTHHFVTTHSITKTTRARLWFDESTNHVAIALTDKADSHAFPLGFTKHGGAYISAARFFEANDLDPSHYAGRYDYEQVQADTLGIPDADDVFVVDLHDQSHFQPDKAQKREQSQAIRAWANANGHDVSARGLIRAAVVEAYRKAGGDHGV